MNNDIFNQKPGDTTQNSADSNSNVAENSNEDLNETEIIKEKEVQGPTTPSGKPLDSLVVEKSEAVLNKETEEKEEVNQFSNDEKYIKTYIGKHYDSITKKKFSLPAFLFTFFYFFYRKMYFSGFVVLGIIIGGIFLIIKFLSFLLLWQLLLIIGFGLLILMLIVGFMFNKIYLSKVTNFVQNYREEGKTNEELLIICTKRGLTNFSRALLIIILPLFILALGLIILTVETTDKNTLKEIRDNIIAKIDTEANILVQKATNESLFTYGDSNLVNDNFKVTIPSYYEKQGNKYVYDAGNNVTDYCEFLFNYIPDYKSAQDLVKKINGVDVVNNNINGIDWQSINKNDLNYYSVTEKDGNIYLVEFNIGSGIAEPAVCENHYNEIMQSISYK